MCGVDGVVILQQSGMTRIQAVQLTLTGQGSFCLALGSTAPSNLGSPLLTGP